MKKKVETNMKNKFFQRVTQTLNIQVFVHLSHENFAARPMKNMDEDQCCTVRVMCPPGKTYFFFTTDGQQLINFNYHQEKMFDPIIKNVQMFDKKVIDVNLNFINYIEIQRKNGNLCDQNTYDIIIDEECGVKPRADEFKKGDFNIRHFQNNFWSKFNIGKQLNVYIKLKGAHLFHITEALQDPYTVIQVGNQEQYSKVMEDTPVDPRWNEDFVFYHANDTDEILFLVEDHDQNFGNKVAVKQQSIGQTKMTVTQLNSLYEPFELALQYLNARNEWKFAGTLYIEAKAQIITSQYYEQYYQ